MTLSREQVIKWLHSQGGHSEMARAILTLLQSAETVAQERERLRSALQELYATVLGECPSLLREDSGGDARLSLEIERLLSTPIGPEVPR